MNLLDPILGQARDKGRGLAGDAVAGLLVIGLTGAGVGFLIAALFWMLARAVGHPAAAAIVGFALITLAAGIARLRQAQRMRRREIAAALSQGAARDPLPALVFDLAYRAGQQFLARRRR